MRTAVPKSCALYCHCGPAQPACALLHLFGSCQAADRTVAALHGIVHQSRATSSRAQACLGLLPTFRTAFIGCHVAPLHATSRTASGARCSPGPRTCCTCQASCCHRCHHGITSLFRRICPYLLSILPAQASSQPYLCCRHICPYHASRDLLNEGASLIFLTYSQLFDPPVRSANGLDALLSGAVVVIDEASAELACSCPAITCAARALV